MGKSIVLFSDGTGNSASKAFKTNVWRTYQALDLTTPPGGREQIAFYRDGVGTETFKPLAALASAFGFGVMHDVRRLYTFLCRNYAEGDTIYAFGFSRGAFTIRLLTGLLAKCGIVQTASEAHLRECVGYAYSAFRRDFLMRAAKKRRMIYNHILPPPYYEDEHQKVIRLPCPRLQPRIAFLGLWDTVDAYGMPVDELKQAIDEWIWPMTLADRKLAPFVEKACHALSLDDERPTFRPVLWTEKDAEDRQRLNQVWFAGVHANVGGGYPLDDLAHVPLVWMLEQAEGAGLRLAPGALDQFRAIANPHGALYDSRSGVAGYYRYGPRSVPSLCNDAHHEVEIKTPQFHPSVAERIARCQVGYSPLSLPRDAALTDPVSGRTAQQDAAFLDNVWDVVWWRRIAYFATVLVTLVLVAMPVLRFLPDRPVDLSALNSFAPGWSKPWIEAFGQHAFLSGTLGLLLIWLFFFESASLQRWICQRGEQAWAPLKNQTPAFAVPQTLLDRAARAVRLSRFAAGYRAFMARVLPQILGFALFVGIIGGSIWFVARGLSYFSPRLLLVSTGVMVFVTAILFWKNQAWRRTIADDLAAHYGTSPPLHLPERMWSYDKAYLDMFKAKADALKRPDGRTDLETYHLSVLLYRDVAFAIGLALIVVLIALLAWPAAKGLAIWSIACGIIYGLADAGEDFVLSRIFAKHRFSRNEARLANTLTRIKFVAITLSITGGLMFLLLEGLDRLLRPRTPITRQSARGETRQGVPPQAPAE